MTASGAVAIVATLDTKASEAAYLSEIIQRCGRRTVLVDVGTTKVASATDSENGGRVAAPAELLKEIAATTRPRIANLHASGAISAVIGVAGGKGSSLFGEVVADLPYGFPKLLISSARPALLTELGAKSDIIIYPTLVDLFGVNGFTARILENAGHAIAAMHYTPPPVRRSTKIVAITAFGVTTPAASRCVARLSDAEIEAIVFPANGAGGRKMESLIAAGEFDAVLDLTTTELADEVVGGTASAGPDRLKAAGSYSLPQLIAPGAVDMVNFGAPSSVPDQFKGRQFYSHTPYTTLMRTTASENEAIGRLTAKRLSQALGPCLVLWPAKGVSDYDREAGIFRDATADAAWLKALKHALPATIECREIDCHINDPEFADTAVAWIVEQLQGRA